MSLKEIVAFLGEMDTSKISNNNPSSKSNEGVFYGSSNQEKQGTR